MKETTRYNGKGVWISDRSIRIAERRAQLMRSGVYNDERTRKLERMKKQLREHKER